MKKFFAGLIVLGIVLFNHCASFAEGTSTWGNSLQPQFVSYNYCNKIFKMDSQRLFLLTLSSITANRFKIDEIQSRGGYVLFTVRATQFLATVMTVDSKHSMLKITPVDGNYYFPIGIVQNCFKYIELNQNTPIEKPQIF
jgi:hypothetical protein